MNTALVVAAAVLGVVAAAHSYLGERYILIRLLRRGDLPRLFGSDWFTRRTLRFAWHLTSIAWLGFAGLLVVLAKDPAPSRSLLLSVAAATFACHSLITALASRGRHLAWLAFGSVALLIWSVT